MFAVDLASSVDWDQSGNGYFKPGSSLDDALGSNFILAKLLYKFEICVKKVKSVTSPL